MQHYTFLLDPRPSFSTVEYFVESRVSGRLEITVVSLGAYGTSVAYSGAVVGGNGSVQLAGDILNVSGLDYGKNHPISINAASDMCSRLQRSSQFNFTFNIAGKLLFYNYG